MTVISKYAVLAMLTGLLAIPAQADVRKYEFQLVTNEVTKGDSVEVAVRLVDKSTGKAVTDAVIFAKRIDMAPDNMAAMAAPLEPLLPGEPGIYRFKTSLVMAGRWRLSLAAKVQGEEGTVESRVVLAVLP